MDLTLLSLSIKVLEFELFLSLLAIVRQLKHSGSTFMVGGGGGGGAEDCRNPNSRKLS